jgi:uncharacterized paraquat-inducible protein A
MPVFEHKDELLLLEDAAERKKAVAEMDRRMRAKNRWVFGYAFFVGMVVGNVAASVLRDTVLRGTPVPGFLVHVVLGLLVGVLVGWVQWLFRRSAQQELRLYLREQGIPVCLHCGYNLRGQVEARCPECGRPFDPALLKPRP